MALAKRRNWGALVIDGKKGRIVLGADIQDHLAHRLIVQGIPRLLVGGKVQQLKPHIAERTAVCAEGNVVVLVVSTKAEATAFARFLAVPPDKGGLGCWDGTRTARSLTRLLSSPARPPQPTRAPSRPPNPLGWGGARAEGPTHEQKNKS